MIGDYLQIDLITALGLNGLPKEKQDEILGQMTSVIEARLSRKLLALLSDNDKKELDALLASEGGDPMLFFKSKVPTFDLIAHELISDFKREMIDLNTAARDEWRAQHGAAAAKS